MKMVAKAQITDMNFPIVTPGTTITGTVILTNIGDEPTSQEAGFFGVMVKTLWDNMEYTLFTYAILAPGETFTYDFHSAMGGIGTMPEGEAVLNVVGRTWIGDAWRVDDEKNLYLAGEPSAPETKPILPLLLIAGLILLFTRK